MPFIVVAIYTNPCGSILPKPFVDHMVHGSVCEGSRRATGFAAWFRQPPCYIHDRWRLRRDTLYAVMLLVFMFCHGCSLLVQRCPLCVIMVFLLFVDETFG